MVLSNGGFDKAGQGSRKGSTLLVVCGTKLADKARLVVDSCICHIFHTIALLCGYTAICCGYIVIVVSDLACPISLRSGSAVFAESISATAASGPLPLPPPDKSLRSSSFIPSLSHLTSPSMRWSNSSPVNNIRERLPHLATLRPSSHSKTVSVSAPTVTAVLATRLAVSRRPVG